MTEQEFIASMRVLFRVWRGTENADTILTDVVATIGSQCFDKTGLELRALEAECGSQESASFANQKRDAYGDYLNKFDGWLGGFRDSFSAPKKP